MSLITKIKDNYLERKVKATAVSNGTDVSKAIIKGDWLADYSWTQATSQKDLEALLHILVMVLDSQLTVVEGKLATGNFYAKSGSGYSGSAETPSASKLYVDLNDGNKLYIYSGSAYVQLGASES